MTSNHSILSSLPVIAFATLAASGETIAIRRGEPSHYRLETTKTAEELNMMYGVSPAQAQAMLAGTTLGWHAPQADPEQYDIAGNPLRRVEEILPPA